MAKSMPWQKKDEGVTTPSRYGSHIEMLRYVLDARLCEVLEAAISRTAARLGRQEITNEYLASAFRPIEGAVEYPLVLEDREGLYVTTRDRLSHYPHPRLADPWRACRPEEREKRLLAKLKEFGVGTMTEFFGILGRFDEDFEWKGTSVQRKEYV
jgi:hypothetical protein